MEHLKKFNTATNINTAEMLYFLCNQVIIKIFIESMKIQLGDKKA